MKNWLKAAHYVVVAVLAGGVGVPWLNGEGLNGVTVIAALGALAVYIRKNTPKQPWARTVASLYTAGVGALVAAATTHDGVLAGFTAISGTEWQQILFLFLGGATVLSASDEDGPVGSGAAEGGGALPAGGASERPAFEFDEDEDGGARPRNRL